MTDPLDTQTYQEKYGPWAVITGASDGTGAAYARQAVANGLIVPGLYDPDEVVCTLLARLPDGPTHVFPFGPDAPRAAEIENARRERVAVMVEASKMFFRNP